MLEIKAVETPEEFQRFQDLCAELSVWDKAMSSQLGLDGDDLMTFFYGHTAAEVAAEHAPPDGQILLASLDGQVCGCVALRKFDDHRGEIKRFYVNPAFRGNGIGRALLDGVIADARKIGYTTLLLETATFMNDAHKLYYAAGFKNIEPYVEIPNIMKPYEIFMELDL